MTVPKTWGSIAIQKLCTRPEYLEVHGWVHSAFCFEILAFRSRLFSRGEKSDSPKTATRNLTSTHDNLYSFWKRGISSIHSYIFHLAKKAKTGKKSIVRWALNFFMWHFPSKQLQYIVQSWNLYRSRTKETTDLKHLIPSFPIESKNGRITGILEFENTSMATEKPMGIVSSSHWSMAIK